MTPELERDLLRAEMKRIANVAEAAVGGDNHAMTMALTMISKIALGAIFGVVAVDCKQSVG